MGELLTLSEAVAAHARLQPHKIAVRDSRRSLSYAQWDGRASRLAQALVHLGLQPGDRVALLAYNRLEWLEIYVALARAALVAVPVNFRLAGAEVAYIVQHSQARAFIVQDALRGVVEGVRAELDIDDHCYVALADTRYPDEHEADQGSSRNTARADQPARWQDYEALIAAAPSAPVECKARPQDLFALMYTSGTTGRPKGAMRSHQGNALIALATALEFGLSRDDTGLLVMPLCHANSLYFGVTFAMLGATIVVDDRAHFDPAALLAQLARDRITFTSLVPTHYVMMLDLPSDVKAGHDLQAVGKLLISSAPARRDTKLAIMELFPNSRLFELYGSTEAGWVTILRPDEQITHLGSVGREWAGSGAIRLLDEQGEEVHDGEVGELFSRTAYVFDGYWRNPEKTAEAFRGAWCSVGDMARRDADGFIHLVDRKSNMIISGGENIYPSEVEAVLASHPGVQDVAVIGLPDPKWGESVRAVIVPRPGHHLDAATMDAWCRPKMAGYKRPRSWAFTEEGAMPRTATGKIQHRRLREMQLE
jgi:acyl-CoA synthetase (AMP-forming)/AMP-acid ligase II